MLRFLSVLVLVLAMAITAQSQVIVDAVVPGSPAHKAGLKAGDVIIECNGEEVKHPAEIKPLLLEQPNDVTVLVLRKKELITLKVKKTTGGVLGFQSQQSNQQRPAIEPVPEDAHNPKPRKAPKLPPAKPE